MPESLSERANRPLDGITVIDFGQIYQGPYATFLMAKAGANVIKIEPLSGEPMRYRAKATKGAGLPIAMINANKRGITLNLKTQRGRELLKEMVERADILLEFYLLNDKLCFYIFDLLCHLLLADLLIEDVPHL